MNTNNWSEAIAHLSQSAPMKRVIDVTPPPVLKENGDVYFDLLESIVSQQLSVKAASTIFGRVLNLFPDRYPHPHLVQAFGVEQFRSMGLSNQKAQYFLNVANFAVEHQWIGIDWSAMRDSEILEMLTQIKGVGVWTVEMVLMFTLNRPDIFPVDDLGIQHGMIRLFELEERGKPLKVKMSELSDAWRPYRTLAARYLWQWKDAN